MSHDAADERGAKATDASVPPPRDGWQDALEEARELSGLSFSDRYERLESACRLVFTILEHHPDREAILAHRDPVPDTAGIRVDHSTGR